MKSGKDTAISYICQLCGIIITVIICFSIYHWWGENEKACFALTLGAVAFLFLCFYNIIFKGTRQGMVAGVLSGLSVIAFANKLYDYERLKTLVPILSNVDPMILTIIVLGGMLSILLLVKLVSYIYNNAEDHGFPASLSGTPASNKADGTYHNTSSEEEENTDNYRTESTYGSRTVNMNHSNARLVLYFLFLIIIIGAVCALFSVLYKNGVLKQEYDFFEVVVFLLNYAGSVLIFFLAVVFVIIFLIEIIRLIVSRMRMFFLSLKEEKEQDPVPLFAISAILDIVVCFLSYKFTGITIDSFYNFLNSGKYLALPLFTLFFGIAFVIFLRLTYATLLLLTEMKPGDVKDILKKVNSRAKIKDRLIKIFQILIDIIFNSILIVLKFVSFIPDFFRTIHAFVLEEEGEFELEDEDGAEAGDLVSSAFSQSDEGV